MANTQTFLDEKPLENLMSKFQQMTKLPKVDKFWFGAVKVLATLRVSHLAELALATTFLVQKHVKKCNIFSALNMACFNLNLVNLNGCKKWRKKRFTDQSSSDPSFLITTDETCVLAFLCKSYHLNLNEVCCAEKCLAMWLRVRRRTYKKEKQTESDIGQMDTLRKKE